MRLDRLILRHRLDDVEQLPLVFVDALHLHVEQRIRRHGEAEPVLDHFGQPHLVGALDRRELRLEIRIVGVLVELGQQIDIVLELRPDPLA